MSDILTDGKASAARPPATVDLYRAVWRWHFYAGLFVLPFLVTLALTGALYLFHNEIDDIVHSDVKRVAAVEGVAHVAPSAQVAAALEAHPGSAVKYTDPGDPSASSEVTVVAGDGTRLAVYVNPYDGRVLGSLPDGGTAMATVRSLHSLKFFGPVARGLIEIAAGWSILLVGTGIYLWWPRGQTGGVVTVRGRPGKRIFWRDVHAVTGLFVGGFIVFLAFTGMPWSNVWGGKVNEWANGSNFGYPAGLRVAVPMSDEHLDHLAHTSWSLGQARMPQSQMADTGSRPIGLDRAVAAFDELGLHRGYAVNIPTEPGGVYTGSVYPADLAEQRVVHLDQYTGRPLLDMRYADYGPLGRWLEWSINIHLGQEFGLANQLVLLLACVGIVLLSVSAAAMWWKRRPKGSMGVPPMPRDRRAFRGLLAILVVGGIVFPLVGASLLVMLLLDWTVTRARRPRPA